MKLKETNFDGFRLELLTPEEREHGIVRVIAEAPKACLPDESLFGDSFAKAIKHLAVECAIENIVPLNVLFEGKIITKELLVFLQ